MGSFQQNGGRNGAPPDANRPTWRPQDQTNPSGFRGRNPEHREEHRGSEHDEHWRDRDSHDEGWSARDPRRWEGSRGSELGYHEEREGRRSTERYGQGQSGYSAGRYGDDRSQPHRNRNDMGSSGPSGRTYDRSFESDERFAGRGWSPTGSAPQHVPAGIGPHRGKGPLGYQRSDERVRELVCEALTDDDQIDASQIQVTVKDGEVTLTGTVDDRRTRREAEDCVFRVSGVRDVHIQLRIAHDGQGGQRRAASAGRPETSGITHARDNTAAHPEVGTSDDDKKHRA